MKNQEKEDLETQVEEKLKSQGKEELQWKLEEDSEDSLELWGEDTEWSSKIPVNRVLYLWVYSSFLFCALSVFWVNYNSTDSEQFVFRRFSCQATSLSWVFSEVMSSYAEISLRVL